MSIESVTPSNHLLLCRPFLLLSSILPSIGVFSNESVLCIRWPKYWSFSFSNHPSSEYSGLISFTMDWLDLLAVQGTLKSPLQHHNSKASVLWHSAFCMVQLSHPYKTTGRTMALTIWMDLCWQSDVSAFNMLSRFLIAFRPKRSIFSFHLLQWFWSPRKKWLVSKISADCLLKSGLIERVIQRVRQTVRSALAEEGSVRRCLKRAVLPERGAGSGLKASCASFPEAALLLRTWSWPSQPLWSLVSACLPGCTMLLLQLPSSAPPAGCAVTPNMQRQRMLGGQTGRGHRWGRQGPAPPCRPPLPYWGDRTGGAGSHLHDGFLRTHRGQKA